MKKFTKRFIAIALTAVMTLGLATAAWADNAHFTYTDIHDEEVDLYVEKHATSALDGYTIPDVTFTFVLRWDQDGDGSLEFADSVAYFVYNEDGTQVWNADTSDGSFRTSSTGRFTLKDGQYAKFVWAGQVEYEVTELPIDDFVQTSPAGGEPATGTVDADGTYIIFENVYIPITEGETTQLAIRKDISWPDGYEMPDLSDEEFTFRVSIDDELYTNRGYTIYDSTMTTELGTDTTDVNGEFTITGGQLALFDDIEVGVDYKVEEVGLGTGWRAVGTTSYEGATTSPIVYTYFTNAVADFTVEKERTDGAIGDDGGTFTFKLTDDSGQSMSGVAYYLYDASGKLVTEDDGSVSAKTTDTDGQFTLQAGQRVVFIGIAEESGYKIEEIAPSSGYEVTPKEGYEGTVNDTVSSYTFTNEELTDITITKYGSQLDTARNLLGGAEFTIYKLKDGGDPENDNDWEPYPDEENAKKTTSKDEADLGTLTFTNLPSGTYRIVETKTPVGYVTAVDPIEVTLPYASEDAVSGAVYSERDGVYYLYDLDYTVDNNFVLQMPNTGGRAWIIILLAICGAAAACVSVYMYRRRRNGKERVKA